MSVRTEKRLTDETCALRFVGPRRQAQEAREVLEALGFRELEESIPWRDAFPDLSDDKLPGMVLRGIRHREGMTQVELSHITGIPQRHLSEIETGKRNIGKDRAEKLAHVLDVD